MGKKNIISEKKIEKNNSITKKTLKKVREKKHR